MVEVINLDKYFFLLIILILWLYFVIEYMNYRKTDNALIFSLAQFGFTFPFTISLIELSQYYYFGYIIVFLIPVFSLYLLIDGIIYRPEKKEK